MRDPDAAFDDPRQAVLYDVLNGDRVDLDFYLAIAREVGARQVIDIGCGTGSLAVRLGGPGMSVVGVDPAGASLDVARGKPGAEHVTWVHGDAAHLLEMGLDVGRAAGRSKCLVSRTVTEVELPLVTFEGSTTVGDEVLRSVSTLRFRGRREVEGDLRDHGFTVRDVREAPDRPGKEFVFLAQREGHK